MKKSFVFYLKIVLLLIGVILILISGFSPVRSQRTDVYPGEFDDTRIVVENGIANSLWYVCLFGSALIFSIGYFFNGLVNKVLVYVFTPIFAVVFLFFMMIEFTPTGATPFIPRMHYGFVWMIYGSIFILTATMISMHRKSEKESFNTQPDLLDN